MEPESLLLKMIGISSPSGNEAKLANYVSKVLKDLNYEVRKDEVGNVIGEIGKGSPRILLCGHMDTVPIGEIEKWNYNPLGEICGGKIYGRGASDAKASAAAMMLAGSEYAKNNEEGKVIFAGVVEEESTAKGVKHLIKTLKDVDYAVFGEPSGVRNITIGYRGWLNSSFSFETEEGHTGASWGYLNALDAADEFFRRIKFYTSQKTASDQFHSLNCSQIWKKGGKKNSWGIVPSKAEMRINFRIPPQITTENLSNDTQRLVQNFELENPKVKVKMKVEDRIEAYEADERSIPVRAFSKAIEETFKGRKPKLLRKTGTGDMNIFAVETGVPTITYGPRSSQDHVPDEYVSIGQYLKSIEIYQKAIENMVKLSSK